MISEASTKIRQELLPLLPRPTVGAYNQPSSHYTITRRDQLHEEVNVMNDAKLTLRINNKDEISPPVRRSGRGALGWDLRRVELLRPKRERGIGKQRHWLLHCQIWERESDKSFGGGTDQVWRKRKDSPLRCCRNRISTTALICCNCWFEVGSPFCWCAWTVGPLKRETTVSIWLLVGCFSLIELSRFTA